MTTRAVAELTVSFNQFRDETRQQFREVRADIAELKTDVAQLKTDVAELKTDVAQLKTDVVDLKVGFGRLEQNQQIILELLREKLK